MTAASSRCARASIAVLALAAGAPVAASAATATAVPIMNQGFEQPALTLHDFTSQNSRLPIRGWSFWDPKRMIVPVGDPLSGASSELGVWRPGTGAYPDGVDESSQVGYVYDVAGVGRGELGIRQLLATRLQANRRYVLQVAVGNPSGNPDETLGVAGFPGYRVELRAGSRLLARDVDTVRPLEGTFIDSELSFTAKAGDPAIGERLEVRLVNRNARAGAEVDFDNIRLSAGGASSTDPSGGTASRGPHGAAKGGVDGVSASGGGASPDGGGSSSDGTRPSSGGAAAIAP